jgi:hypothetical protein
VFELQRLTIARQRRLAQSLLEAEQDKSFVKSLNPDVRTALSDAVKMGEGLDPGRELPPLVLDNTTDTVFSSFENLLESVEQGMTDRIVAPLPPDRAKKKAAASFLLKRVFPDGTGFLSSSMPLQYTAMTTVLDLLTKDPECVAAVKELGVGYFVDHMEAHLIPYGRAVKTSDGRDLEAAGTAFHDAYTRLAKKVDVHHEGDAAASEKLCKPYQRELEAQREEDRQSRARRAKKKREGSGP